MIRLQPSRPDDTFWDQTIIDDLFGDIEGNIFVIPGEYEGEYIDQINQELNKYPYAVIMITSDEHSKFPINSLYHPRMKVWLQYPKEWHQVDHLLPAGYSPGCQDIKVKEKNLEWFWGGQVNHQDRIDLVHVLRELDNGFLLETAGFTQGIELEDYLELMAQAKLVPCPRGNISPDTMRMYDALELGCTPVILNRDKPFYERLLPGNSFPVIDSWADLLSVEYQDCREGWNIYKKSLVGSMLEDIGWLKAT